MILTTPLPFIKTCVHSVNQALIKLAPEAELSFKQKFWLGFCIYAIFMTNSICWAQFERASLGKYTVAALSWVFRHAKISWDLLLVASVRAIFRKYSISEGIAVIDETDRRRSKKTKRLYRTHKMKDKKTGGYFMGQSIVFLVIVTPLVTIPAGFRFYQPDPVLVKWERENRRLKNRKVPKSKRPAKPSRHPAYPTKQTLALSLLRDFRRRFPEFQVTCVVADALYGIQQFLDEASAIFGGVQVISQARKNQHVRSWTKKLWVSAYFDMYPGVSQRMTIRGGQSVDVIVSAARLHVCSHGKKRFVIALKYEGEAQYRYLLASELSWRHQDIVQAYTFRWLVEVFFQDWKAYEGWGQKTPQFDEEGARRSVLLSLLSDHCLFFYPAQQARFEHNLPAYSVGSLHEKIQMEGMLHVVQSILEAEDPKTYLQSLTDLMEEVFELRESTKHLSGRDMGSLEPSPSLLLKYPGNAVEQAA